MKIAIVGGGSIANTHARALRQLGQRISLVIGTDLARTEAFGRTWGAEKASICFADALAPGIEAVHICTPPVLHYRMASEALDAGKHVICEKPLALAAADAKALADLAKRKGLLGAVNFNTRFYEACTQARALVQSPDFGPIQLIHGAYLQEFHLLPADYMWRYDAELGGLMRAVTEIGSHWIDLARFWSGLEIEAVSAVFGCFQPERILNGKTMYPAGHKGGAPVRVDSEDAAAVALRFSNGALGNMLLSEVSPGRSNALSMEVSSANGALWWNSEDPYRLNQSLGKFRGSHVRTNAFGGGFTGTFAVFFEKLYNALAVGYDPDKAADFPTFEDGWKNVAVCESIYKSACSASTWTEV